MVCCLLEQTKVISLWVLVVISGGSVYEVMLVLHQGTLMVLVIEKLYSCTGLSIGCLYEQV